MTTTTTHTNPLATASLVLALVASVVAIPPVLGVFAPIPLAALAVIFGGVGLAASFRRGGVGRGFAIAGIVVALAGPLVMHGIGLALFR